MDFIIKKTRRRSKARKTNKQTAFEIEKECLTLLITNYECLCEKKS